MKNNIFFKIKFILLIFLLIFNFNVNADEFFFEGNEILILNEGNNLTSKNGAKITSSDNIVIESLEFDYDKLKQYLILEKEVIINDQNNGTVIKANKISYNRITEDISFSFLL